MAESQIAENEKENVRFWKWVEELKEKADGGPYSWRQLEALGGVANGTLSRRARHYQDPTVENCEAIATALKMPLRDVLTEAGLIDIPYKVDEIKNADFKTILSIMRDLSPERRRQMLDYADYLYQKEHGS
jgi:transcriptional regulator with XRE-family HTH domain